MLTHTLSLERGSSGIVVGPDKSRRDPSFSSYLTGAEECFVLSLAKPAFRGDEEIGVFGAEKYFSESLDEEMPKVCEGSVTKFSPEQDTAAPYAHDPIKSKTQSRASSLSLSSSGNSQSGLLQRAARNPGVTGGSKVRGRSCLRSFRCSCVCSDKNSVAIDEYETLGKVLNLTRSGAAKETVKKGFSPVAAEGPCRLNPGPGRETYSTSSKDLSPRKSLEAFGSPLLARPNKPFSFETERPLAVNREHGLPFPKPAEILIPTVVHGAYAESDSDASSDLFEIEDFTGKANPIPSRSLSGSATPTAGYAPSEASIVWSVVTASAADFPITSENEELKTGKNTTNRNASSTATTQKVIAAGDNKPRRLSSSFLACNSQDSVKIADHAHTANERVSDTKMRKSQDSPAPVFRPQTDAKLTGFGPGWNTLLGLSSRTLAQSNSPHGSNMLYRP